MHTRKKHANPSKQENKSEKRYLSQVGAFGVRAVATSSQALR